jgi:hypothetical protein
VLTNANAARNNGLTFLPKHGDVPVMEMVRWVLTTANATGTNGLTCLPKHGGVGDNKILVTHPMTD